MRLSHADLCTAVNNVVSEEIALGQINPLRFQWLTEVELMARLRAEITTKNTSARLESRLVGSGNKKPAATNYDIEIGFPILQDWIEGKYAHYFGPPEPGAGISKDLTSLRTQSVGHFVLFLPPMYCGSAAAHAPYRLLDTIQCEGIHPSNRRLLSGVFTRTRPRGKKKPKWILASNAASSRSCQGGILRTIVGNNLHGLWAIVWSNP